MGDLLADLVLFILINNNQMQHIALARSILLPHVLNNPQHDHVVVIDLRQVIVAGFDKVIADEADHTDHHCRHNRQEQQFFCHRHII